MTITRKSAAVTEYLLDRFVGFDIEEKYDPTADATLYTISDQKQRYQMAVQSDWLNETPDDAKAQSLTEFRAAEIMQEVGDFLVVVTLNGCVFA